MEKLVSKKKDLGNEKWIHIFFETFSSIVISEAFQARLENKLFRT